MAERTIVLARITVHFSRGGEVMESDYWVIPRKGKGPVTHVVPGSERPCACDKKEEFRVALETQKKLLLQSRRGGDA